MNTLGNEGAEHPTENVAGLTLASAVDRLRQGLQSFRSSYPPAYPIVSNFAGIGNGYPTKDKFKKHAGGEKDKDWKKKWLLAMVQYCAIKAEDIFSKRLAMSRLALDLHSQTTTSTGVPTYATETSSHMPEYEFINPITNLHQTRMGEFASQEYEFNAYVTNEEAKSKRDELYKQMLMDALLRDADPELAEEYGEGLPRTDVLLEGFEGTLEEFINQTYKDKHEEVAERLFRDWIERSGWREWLKQTYKLYLITETAYAMPYIDPQSLEVKNPLIHPTQMVLDVDCEDNYFSNAKYFIYFDYQSFESLALEHPELTLEEIQENIGSRTHLFGLPIIREHENNRYDIMVVYANFIYPEEKTIEYPEDYDFEVVEDEFGELKIDDKKRARRYKERYEELYSVKVIGGSKIVSGDVAEFQIRSVDDPRFVNLGARALVYDYSINPNHPNLTVQISPLIKYLNYYMWKLTEKMSKMKGAMLVIRQKKMPTFTGDPTKDLEILMGNISRNNVIVVDDDEMAMPGSDQPAVQAVNLDGEQEIINTYIQAIEFCNSKIREYMNMPPSRTGGIGKYETSTGAQINKTQSDYGTADKLISFETFVEKVATDIINLLKIATVTKKRRFDGLEGKKKMMDAMSLRLGDEVVSIDNEFLFTDIGITVKKRFNKEVINRRLDEIFQLYLQQGGAQDLRALSAFVHMQMMDDPEEKDNFLQKFLFEQEKRQLEQQQAMMAQQQEMQTQQQLVQGQVNAGLADQAAMNRLMEIEAKKGA